MRPPEDRVDAHLARVLGPAEKRCRREAPGRCPVYGKARSAAWR